MSDWKNKMADILQSNRLPTNDELEEALHGALAERSALVQQINQVTEERDVARGMVTDMSVWLGKITSAFLKSDADALTEVLGKFVAARVKIVTHPDPAGPVARH